MFPYPLSMWRIWLLEVELSSELYRNMRACGHVRPCRRRLLPSQAAADGLQFEAGVLRGLHSAADSLAHERRNFDPALFNIQDYGPSRRRRRGLCVRRIWSLLLRRTVARRIWNGCAG